MLVFEENELEDVSQQKGQDEVFFQYLIVEQPRL